MLLAIVIAHIVVCDPVEILVAALLRIVEALAVAVVAHKRAHVGLVVAEEKRGRVLVVRREVPPVPRRMPDPVVVGEIVEMVEDRRPDHEERIEDVVRAVDERGTDNLYVPLLGRRGLHHDGGDVLEHVLGQHCLDDEHVVVSLDSLYDAQVVNVAVSVQVEVRDDIGRVVEQRFELLDVPRLREGGAHSLQVKVEREVFDGRGHAGRGRDRAGTRDRDRGGVRSLVVVVRRYRHNACREASRKQKRHCGENRDSCFHGIK